jgi:hypothetical protein
MTNLDQNNLQTFENKIIPMMNDLLSSQGELVILSLQILAVSLKIS